MVSILMEIAKDSLCLARILKGDINQRKAKHSSRRRGRIRSERVKIAKEKLLHSTRLLLTFVVFYPSTLAKHRLFSTFNNIAHGLFRLSWKVASPSLTLPPHMDR